MTTETQTQSNPHHRLILSSRVLKTAVFNPDGERIGHIDDISIERKSGKAVYAIMSFGGFLGIGDKYHPVPWALLTYETERGGYVVPLDKAALDSAPYYDRLDLEELGGESPSPFDGVIADYYARYPLPMY